MKISELVCLILYTLVKVWWGIYTLLVLTNFNLPASHLTSRGVKRKMRMMWFARYYTMITNHKIKCRIMPKACNLSI